MKNTHKYAEHLPYLVFIVMLGIFFITRFWRLDTLPTGLHVDEAGMAYDAWCLANYGVDRFLNPWPVYLTNYGGGQSILYAYLCAGLFKVFGYSIYLVRLPAICFSFLTFLFGMKIARKAFPENQYLPFLTGLLVLVCPYFILNSRYGLDCNLMLGASAVFLYFFFKAVSENNVRYYIVSGITGGVMLYTYILSYIILPLFLLLGVVYCLGIRKFSLKKWAVMALPMGVLASPLIVVQIINIFDLPELHFGGFTFTKFLNYRIYEISGFRWEYFLLAIKNTLIGGDLNYASIPQFYNLYGISVVLFGIGMIGAIYRLACSIKRKEADALSILLLWFLSVVFVFSFVSSTVYRINAVYLAVALIVVEGIHVLCQAARRWITPRTLCLAVACLYLACFLRFGIYYYSGRYTRENYPLDYFDILVPEAIDFLGKHPEYRHKGTYMAEWDIYFALSCFPSPYEIETDPFEMGHLMFGYYRCGTLPEIDTDYNYIVRDTFTEYADELRAVGYSEISYPNYFLFYMER